MALDLSPASWIRSASGLLYVLLGLFVLFVRPWRGRNAAFAGFLILFGLRPGVINLAIKDEKLAAGAISISLALCVGAAIFLAMAAWAWLRDGPSQGRRVWGIGLVLAVILAVVSVSLTWPVRTEFTAGVDFSLAAKDVFPFEHAALGLVLNFGAALLAASLANARTSGSPRPSATAWVGFGLGVYAAFDLGGYATELGGLTSQTGLGYVVSEGLVFFGAFWCFRASGTPVAPIGRAFAAALLVCLGLGVLKGFTLSNFDPIGTSGLARAAGFLVIAYAVFRLDLLQVPLQKGSFRTGALASVALAALLITVQLTQNVLSDALGVVLGGIVAGAAVFASFPIQRAAERAMASQHAGASSGDEPLEIYRSQVQVAWRDGKLAANERLMLRDLRRRLHLDADAAEAVEDDVAAHHAKRGGPRKR